MVQQPWVKPRTSRSAIAESLEPRRLFASLIVNGSFEQPSIGAGASGQGYTTYNTGSGGISGWRVMSGTVDIAGSAGTWNATDADGVQCIDLNGLSAGSLRQTVPTNPGQSYVLKFSIAGFPTGGTTKTADVFWGSGKLASLTFNATGKTLTNMGWTGKQYTVTATGTQTALTFTSTMTGSVGMAFDKVSLEPVVGTGQVQGNVFNDANGDGTKQAGEGLLANRRVYIDQDRDGVWDAAEKSVLTNTSGNYALTGLGAGQYRVRVVNPAGAFTTAPAGGFREVRLTTNSQILTGRVFGQAAGGAIIGTVFRDENANGLIDADGAGIAGRRVWLDTDNDNVWDAAERSYITDARGNFAFGALAAGTYRLKVQPATGFIATTPTSITITLAANSAKTGNLFGQQPIYDE